MTKVLLIFLFIFFFTLPVLAQVDTAWIRRYNGPWNGHDYPYALAIDDLGNVLVTGYSLGNGGFDDYATIKYYPNGDMAWVGRYDGPGNRQDIARAIAVDHSGNVYVTGYSQNEEQWGNYATIKYYANGDTIWVRRYSGGSIEDCAEAIAVDHVGNVYVTGYSWGVLTRIDFATIKYDPNGNEIWVRRYNGPGNSDDVAWSMAVDDSGNVYVTGWSDGISTSSDYATIKYFPNGDTAWVRRYNGPGNGGDDARAIAVDNSGNVYVTGSSYGSGSYSDYATIKYLPNGDTDWVRRYNGPGNSGDGAGAIAVDGSGNVYVTGLSRGSGTECDYATIKYDPNGDAVWISRYNGPGDSLDMAVSPIALDGSHNVYLTGWSYGNGTSSDYATIKYDLNGNELWVERYNGKGNAEDYANSIAIDDSGDIFVTGASYDSSTDYDYVTIKYLQHREPTVQIVYTRDTNGKKSRVFKVWDQFQLVIVFQNPNEFPMEVQGSDIQITWKGENTGNQGSYIPQGTYTIPAKGTAYVPVLLYFPASWNSTNFSFVGDKVDIEVKYKYDSQSKGWSVYVDEWGVPEWLNTGTTMHIEDFLHGPVSDYGNEHTNQMWLDMINGQVQSGGKSYGAVLDSCRGAGVDAISIGAEFYNYGRLEGGDGRLPLANTGLFNCISLFPLKMWAPTGPGSDYYLTTPPYNPDPSKTVGLTAISNLISAAHDITRGPGLKVLGYIETVGIYSPSDRARASDLYAYGRSHAAELGWARYGYWRRTLLPPYYKHDSNKPPAPEPLVLGKDDALSFLGDNPLDYKGTCEDPLNSYSYADVAMATCFNGKAKEGELANDDAAFSVYALNMDSDPWDKDPSFHYHMCRQISQLMDRGFDGFFFDNPGRVIETESSIQSILDYTCANDRSKPIEIMGGSPENSFFGLCFCPNCTELKGSNDENMFARNSVANYLKHLRAIIKTKNWQNGALLSSNYYVPWESIVAGEDLSSGDKIPIGSKSFALWAYLSYAKSFKPMQVDMCRVPTKDETSDGNLEWRIFIPCEWPIDPTIIKGTTFNDTNICHIATAWANRVGMRLPYKRIYDDGQWTKVSRYIRFFKEYGTGDKNVLRDPCMEMKFHSLLDFFSPPDDPDPQVTNFHFSDPTKYPPYVVLYSIPDTTGEKYRVLWVMNDSDPGNPHTFEGVVKVPPGTKLKQVELLSPDIEGLSSQKRNLPKAVSSKDSFWSYCNAQGKFTQGNQSSQYVYVRIDSVTIWSVVATELELDVTWTSVGNPPSEPTIPKKYMVSQNYPNPFNLETTIKYNLPKSSRVNLTIYNILGQRVKVLVDEYENAGVKTVRWNGKNDKGEEIASGIYFYLLKADDYISSKKMLLLK